MVLFSQLVAEKWNINETLAAALCEAYEEGDWPFYLHDYVPEISAELELRQVWEVYDFLDSVAALSSKKKRLVNALKKAKKLDEALQAQIEISVDPHELDDMLISHRPNARSRAQTAMGMGLGPLADLVEAQEEENGTLEERAEAYVGTHESLKTTEDVIGGVRDILAERFAYDETVRAMTREFCFDDGYFTVSPKKGKESAYAEFRDTELPICELERADTLKILAGEERKHVRVKLGVQLFRITEVLRQHFIENPDAIGFDLICEAIDDSWQRLLQTMAEKDVKDTLRRDAVLWALGAVAKDLSETSGESAVGTLVVVSIPADGRVVSAALNSTGRLLGASRDQRALPEDATTSDTLTKLLNRYRPATVIAVRGEEGGNVEGIVRATVDAEHASAEVVVVDAGSVKSGMCESEFFKTKCGDLDMAMRRVYAAGLAYVKPLGMIAEVGVQYFDVHPLQNVLPEEELGKVVNRVATERLLHAGIPVREVTESVLTQSPGATEALLNGMRTMDVSEPFAAKGELYNVKGMTEKAFRNMTGYIVLPSSNYALDRTLVHPYHYERYDEMARELKVSVEGLVANPDVINSYVSDDFEWQLYVRTHATQQLLVGQKLAQTRQVPRRKLRLDELDEGMIVQGKVTNISPFGAFVNINAVCDGLIHISQLADSYVENPEQVVSVGESVSVRVVKVDMAKRRISLSMKGLGRRSPRVKPSANHISNLIDHFSNR